MRSRWSKAAHKKSYCTFSWVRRNTGASNVCEVGEAMRHIIKGYCTFSWVRQNTHASNNVCQVGKAMRQIIKNYCTFSWVRRKTRASNKVCKSKRCWWSNAANNERFDVDNEDTNNWKTKHYEELRFTSTSPSASKLCLLIIHTSNWQSG